MAAVKKPTAIAAKPSAGVAATSGMTLTHIKNAQALPDPMLNFQWVIKSMPEINGLRLGSAYAESIDVQFNNIKVESGVFSNGGYDYFPGFHDISAFGMVFYEDIRASALRYILEWKKLVKNYDTGVYGLPKQYKKNITITVNDQRGLGIMEVTLKGCWPADTSNWQFQYSSAERITLSQNFSCDAQDIKFLKP